MGVYIAVSGPLYLSSTGITNMFAVFHAPNRQKYVVLISGELIVSVYIYSDH